MACVAHQQQGLFVAFSSRHLLWSKRLKLKQCLSKCHLIGRADWHYILSVGPPHICGSKLNPLKISGFQGSAKSDDSVTSANGLQVPYPKTSVRLDENGEVKSESPKANNFPLSCASEANENLAVSSGIHKLLKKWHIMLHTLPPNQGEEEILGEPPPYVLPNSLQGTQKTVKGQSLKAAWSYFLALDATINIPFLIFLWG